MTAHAMPAKGNLGAISDRAFLVTAGGSGIGRACARAIAAAGGRVAIADINEVAANDTVAEMTARGGSAIAVAADVRKRAEVEAAVDATERAFGRLSGLVAAAGISIPEPAAEINRASWDAVIGLSLTSCFVTCQVAGRRMIAGGGGAIVTISSSDAFSAHAGRLSYCAAKFAMVGLVRTLALEWGRHNIRVNTVAPGITDTPAARRNVPAEQIENVLIDRTPLARMGDPDEMGRAAAFLLSDAASYISGAVIPVDGGLTAGYITRWNGGDYASKRMLANGEYGPPLARAT
jgi:NAD(P)-dependent dehydrogenase (short-subunit alcohol dehydrogenase family)